MSIPSSAAKPIRIGLVSDTHGLLRPKVLHALAGCEHILHAGDIGEPSVLEALASLAPVTAVRGNNDRGAWAERLRDTEVVPFGEVLVYMIHDVHELDIDPAAAGMRVVVSGHSHHPRVERRAGVLFVNPGSAGPRRFRLPIAVGELVIDGGTLTPRIIEIDT